VKPNELAIYLYNLIQHNIKLSTMIWGPPGVGKSSIVAQTAAAHGINFIDLRLSQLAPTDLRGLPVADTANGLSHWYPPEFLPRDGKGVLFLDELNLAPPTMQGMAQQLILDRRVGNYEVPESWFIWAAGNRKEDRAAVFDMPAPLANRFLHLEVEPELDSFKAYALNNEVHEHIIAFLSFRPTLLHKVDTQQAAWPSPRSWVMANTLHRRGLDVTPAVGAGVAAEFHAYVAAYSALPDLKRILEGEGNDIPFPDEPSVRYAAITGLTMRAEGTQAAFNAFRWVTQNAPLEWMQLFAIDIFRLMRRRGKMKDLTDLIAQDFEIQDRIADYQKLIEG
jgi:MoxR-like ATPase